MEDSRVSEAAPVRKQPPVWVKDVHLLEWGSRSFGIPIEVIGAIVMQESGFDRYAMRFEISTNSRVHIEPEVIKMNRISEATERVAQMTSWGYMQVMGYNARNLGFKGPLNQLSEPDLAIKFGCLHVQSLARHHENLDDIISSYNQGSPKKDVFDHYLNQEYVDAVRAYMAQLTGAF